MMRGLILTFVLLSSTVMCHAGFYIDNFTVTDLEDTQVLIKASFDQPTSFFQFYLTLPEWMQIKKIKTSVDTGYLFSWNTNSKDTQNGTTTYIIVGGDIYDGGWGIGTDYQMCTVHFEVLEGYQMRGEININTFLVHPGTYTGIVGLSKGDVNGDGEVNLGDINAATDCIINKEFYEEIGYDVSKADVDGNGYVNMADVASIWSGITEVIPPQTINGTTYYYMPIGYAMDESSHTTNFTVGVPTPGDVDGDGRVSINDVTTLINNLLSGDTSASVADVNGDGNVKVDDVTALINYLLTGNW